MSVTKMSSIFFYILTRANYNAVPAECTEKDEVISQLTHALEKEKELRQVTGLKLEKYIHTDFHEIRGQLSPQLSDCDTDIECIEGRIASYMTPMTPERGDAEGECDRFDVHLSPLSFSHLAHPFS